MTITDEMLFQIAKIAIEMGVDGHRADLVMMKSAKTTAALDGRDQVTVDDVHQSVDLALLQKDIGVINLSIKINQDNANLCNNF